MIDLSSLTAKEIKALKDACLNTAIELSDDAEDEDAAVLAAAYKKLFGKPLKY